MTGEKFKHRVTHVHKNNRASHTNRHGGRRCSLSIDRVNSKPIKDTCSSLWKFVDTDTGDYWTGGSLKSLSQIAPISLSSINRLQSKTAGIKLTKKYRLFINEQ